MRRPRFRFTILGLMMVVAATATGLAVLLGMLKSGRQAQIFRDKAAQFTQLEQFHRNRAASYFNSCTTFDIMLQMRREDANDERAKRLVRRDERLQEFIKDSERFEDAVADHYRELAKKYVHAVDRPWEPTAPDPTPPGPRPEQPSLDPAVEPAG